MAWDWPYRELTAASWDVFESGMPQSGINKCVSEDLLPAHGCPLSPLAPKTPTCGSSCLHHGQVDALLLSVMSPLCLSFQGLPYKHLITHHQEPPHRYLISTYDDHYNRHGYNPGLPPLRTWNGQKLLWLPEKSDFPLLGIFIIQGFPLIWSVKVHRPMQLYLPYAEGATQVTLAPGEQWMTQSGLSPIVPSGLPPVLSP